jgi:hypothetical protein
MSSALIDPAVAKFVAQVTQGGAGVSDSIAGLLLKLAARVANLERVACASRAC